MASPDVVLTYFNGRGYGERIRITLAVAGISFREQFITEKFQLDNLRQDGQLLFGQLPLLEIDGLKLVQAHAIMNYIAAKANMLGDSAVEKARIDMLCEGVRDFAQLYMGHGINISIQEMETKILSDKGLTRYLPVFEKELQNNKTGFLVGKRASLADSLLFYVLMEATDLMPDALTGYPKLEEFLELIKTQGNVAEYLKNQRKRMNDARYAREVMRTLDRFKR